MTDSGPDGPREPDSGGERRLPSARERASGGRPQRPERGGGRRRARGERGSKPTPARTLSDATNDTLGEPEAAEASFEVEGVPWTVRIVGRSSGGRGVAGASLMLLGFWRDSGVGPDGPPARELLTVSRPLASLSPRELGEALARAEEPADPDESKPFFPDPRDRRRR